MQLYYEWGSGDAGGSGEAGAHVQIEDNEEEEECDRVDEDDETVNEWMTRATFATSLWSFYIIYHFHSGTSCTIFVDLYCFLCSRSNNIVHAQWTWVWSRHCLLLSEELLDLKILHYDGVNPLTNPFEAYNEIFCSFQMLQPLINLKQKQCSPPYLKYKRTHKNKGMSKSKFGEKKKKEMLWKRVFK